MIDRDDRLTMSLLRQAVGNGWQIPDSALKNGASIAVRIIANEMASNRDRCRALELLSKMRDSNINAMLALDKIDRLDAGHVTERIELAPISLRSRNDRFPNTEITAALPSTTHSDM